MAKNCQRPECVDGCTRVAWECLSATPLEETIAPDQDSHVRLYYRHHSGRETFLVHVWDRRTGAYAGRVRMDGEGWRRSLGV